ncbi:hypothetical protein [Tersicoccus sp. Bi-70]|uniref:hypothetical protein n=1 Tax=Tersicoccus sp. Bi-70 TaxID=1897634 RepID=UPI000977C655|nr:hypothetical protein [Tersicoccus sp. Bi-70]OMH34328.1 hypothetical protein BGP79_04250 [Tersicoccus sp. Bi-70]
MPVVGSTVLFMGLCLALPRRAPVTFTATAGTLGGVAALSGALALLQAGTVVHRTGPPGGPWPDTVPRDRAYARRCEQ